MNKIKYYSPIRLLYGLQIVISALVKVCIARLLFSKPKNTLANLETDGFLVEASNSDEKQIESISFINDSFEEESEIRCRWSFC